MTRFLLDTNILVYVTGAPHPCREPCRALVAVLGRGPRRGETTTNVIGEFAHQRLRQSGSRTLAARDARSVAELLRIHDVQRADVLAALTLYEDHAGLDAADAILAAVTVARGATVLVSADRAFDALHGLRRVDPLDAEAMAALLA